MAGRSNGLTPAKKAVETPQCVIIEDNKIVLLNVHEHISLIESYGFRKPVKSGGSGNYFLYSTKDVNPMLDVFDSKGICYYTADIGIKVLNYQTLGKELQTTIKETFRKDIGFYIWGDVTHWVMSFGIKDSIQRDKGFVWDGDSLYESYLAKMEQIKVALLNMGLRFQIVSDPTKISALVWDNVPTTQEIRVVPPPPIVEQPTVVPAPKKVIQPKTNGIQTHKVEDDMPFMDSEDILIAEL